MTSAPTAEQTALSEPQPFDFRHPGRAVQDGIRRLETAHEAFIERLESILGGAAGEGVSLTLRAVTQGQLALHLRMLPLTSVLLSIPLDPHPGEVLLEMSASAGLAVVERLLGGSGVPGPSRRPTDLEEAILAPVADDMGGALLDALIPLGVSREADAHSVDPYVLQATSSNGFIVTVEYQISMGEAQPVEGLVLVYPLEALQALAEASGRMRPRSDEELQALAGPSPFIELIPEVMVPFCVRLNPSQVSFGEILALEPGDVLRLDHGVNDPALGIVGDVPVLAGSVGQSRSKLALEMIGWLS